MTQRPGRHSTGHDLLCVGSYTDDRGCGTGLTTFAIDTGTGALTPLSTYPMQSASYLAAHPDLPIIYAVTEATQGMVSTLRVDADGQLTLLAQCSSGGAGPCHCVATPDGRALIVSNYDGGSVAVLLIDEDGAVRNLRAVTTRSGSGPDLQRQSASHPHMAVPCDDGTFLLADLGTDEILRYDVFGAAPMAVREQAFLAPGTGPRHVAVIPDSSAAGRPEQQLIVVGELSGDVTLLPSGIPTPQHQRYSVSAHGPGRHGGSRNYPAHIEVSPGGNFIYLTNRGDDSLTSFARCDDTLHFVDRVSVGKWPRHLAAFGDFLYVAAQEGHAIDVIRADHATGALQHLGRAAQVASPACAVPVTVPYDGQPDDRIQRTEITVSDHEVHNPAGWDAPVCGMTWGFTGVRGTWTTPAAEQSMAAMAELEINWVTLGYAAVQETAQSTTIPFRDHPSLTDDEVRSATRRAQVQGLKVCLKPMVNVADGTWRAYIGFFDWDVPGEPAWGDWFESYRDYIVHQARLAAELDVDLFCIGCELVRADSQDALWRALIADVRQVYHGPITYNCDKYQEDHVTWWDAVDVISSSGYYPSGDWESELDRIEAVVTQFGKPFCFLEAGCPSRVGAQARPNDWTLVGAPDQQVQADYLDEMLTAAGRRPWVGGFMLWDWPASLYDPATASSNDDYCVYGKSGVQVIAGHYARAIGDVSL